MLDPVEKIPIPLTIIILGDKSKIFAIGDGLNDIEMLSSVGYSVAMGNSVPELFQICKFSTKSFVENGTIEALDWIIEGLN